jgi:pyrimidine-nucleoside phosphorylase
VGKLSGRGLGFSGGTIDKLESIPGFTAQLGNEAFVRQLHDIGLVIGAQTADLAPADGKLYSLRDVTGTVPVLPLIASSIMSKKLASGADAIVLDVKVGYGAFMRTLAEAQHLARLMVEIGRNAGRRMAAVISAMNEPLGRTVGNALELKEAIATLQGYGPVDFEHLVVALAAQMLRLAGHTGEPAELHDQARGQLKNGQAWEKFRQFVSAQGGDVRQIDDPNRLPEARLVEPVCAATAGWLAEIRADEVGLATVELGGGRQKKGDLIDLAVGVVLEAKVGDRVELDQPLCHIHANAHDRLTEAQARLARACRISTEPVVAPPLIYDILA